MKFPKSPTYRSAVPELPESPTFYFFIFTLWLCTSPHYENCVPFTTFTKKRDRAWEDQAVGLPPADLSCKMPLELHGIVPWPSSLGVSGDEGGQKKYSTQEKISLSEGSRSCGCHLLLLSVCSAGLPDALSENNFQVSLP